jgi:hypothetical protein
MAVAGRLIVLQMTILNRESALAAIPYQVLNVRLTDYFGIEWRAVSPIPERAKLPAALS